MYLVADVVNQALDAAGIDFTIGDVEEGTKPARVALRAYSQCRQQLLRAAHWDRARKQAPMTLLADVTGSTPDIPQTVIPPWTYEYAIPLDCLKARFVPWNQTGQGAGIPPGNIQISDVPLTGGMGRGPLNRLRLIPARFLVATDYNNAPAFPPGYETPGLSPTARLVVCTNVRCAELVYTADMIYPSMWDPQFRAALVAYLASELALPLSKDKKFGLELRDRNIRIAKEKILQARITDGNEGTFSSDIRVDWMDVRTRGGGRGCGGDWGGGDGPGVLGYGWDGCAFAGSATAF